MKKLVKIIVVAAFAIGFGVTAQAQDRSASIETNAEVFDAISVTQISSLEFGQVMKGAKKYISLEGVAASSDGDAVSSVGIRAGSFRVNAGAGAAVTLTFNNLSALTLVGEGDNRPTMPILFNQNHLGDPETTLGYGTSDSDITPLVLGANSIVFPSTSVENANGTYVYVGATVNPAADQASGEYTGTLTLTATYN